jgi:predicted DNA-binding transcriptional regulator AlpA
VTGALTILDEPAIRRIVTDVIRAELMAALEEVFKDPEPKTDRLLSATEVAEFLGVHKRDIRRLVLEGIIPPGIGLGRRRLRWRMSAIHEALARLEAEQTKNAASTLTRSRLRASVSSVNQPNRVKS